MVIALSVISVCLFLFALAFIIFRRIPSPDFTEKPYCTDDELINKVYALSHESRESEKNGAGLRLNLIEKTLKKAQILLSRKQNLLPFEREFYDNFRAIAEEIESVRASIEIFCDLPHHGGLPRVYNLCQLMVKAKNGYLSKENFAASVKAFNEESPLDYKEIKALPIALSYAFLELFTILASKIIKTNERIEQAKKDAIEDKLNSALIKSSAYIVTLKASYDGLKKKEIDMLLADNGIDATKVENGYYSALAYYERTLSALVRSLYEKSKWLTSELIQRLSPVYEIYSASESFNACDEKTKEEYLSLTHQKSLKMGKSELFVANQNIALESRENKDLSFYILPKERGAFTIFSYLASHFVLSVALIVLVATLGVKSYILILSFFPVLVAVSYIVDAVFRAFSPKRILPRLHPTSLKDDDGASIVYTRLIANEKDVQNAIFMLKAVAAANPSKRFNFVLLADFKASKSEIDESDEKLISQLKTEFKTLDENKFTVLVRKRAFIKSKGMYQGWERKRGALLEYNSLILRNERYRFSLILGNIRKVKNVIALDADTFLSSATELLCTLEHPYSAKKSVLSLSLNAYPAKRDDTRFLRFYSGASGASSYECHFANLAHDLFGKGNFTGKGIYRLKEFDESVRDAFMDERVLSHDFIEGAKAGCYESDEKALDAFPSTFSSYLTRSQRWLRGDWQLLPWLFSKTKRRDGKRIKNDLHAIDRWHIFKALFFSLAPVFSLALIFVAAISGNAECLIFAFLPQILEAIIFVFPTFFTSLKRGIKAFFVLLFNLSTLPVVALFNAYSICLTIIRLIRKTSLLEWKVFAHASTEKDICFYQLFPVLGLFLFNLFLGKSIILYVLIVLFVLSLPVESLLNEPTKNKKLLPAEENLLTLLATKTWNYFASSLNEKYNFLPPDNYCEIEEKGFATRTSPTNIGMAIVSTCAANELKIIDRKTAENLIGNIIATVEKLEKYHGIPYNWYDIKSLEPLYPRYVSSVDCGNLLCSLMTAKNYSNEETQVKIDELLSACEIEKLYDSKAGLMRIGYNEIEKTYDGYYDLLGSEAAITYLVAIGLGKIPLAAFNNLSKRTVKSYRAKALYSWTGGAFEYLMPTLFFEFFKGGLLDESAKSVVKSQLCYAKNIKSEYFGVSESQYSLQEENGDYKYKAFGVPSLALSSEDGARVIAPYASILCLEYKTTETLANLEKLFENKLIGKYGAYEAVEDKRVIRSFMAHHQGMVMCSICNFLCDRALIKSMLVHPSGFVADTLLYLALDESKAKKKIIVKNSSEKREEKPRKIDRHYIRRNFALSSYRDYAITLDENGKSFSYYKGYDLTRRDSGFSLFLKNGKELTSLTALGKCEMYRTKAKYEIENKGVRITSEASVLTSVVGEKRTITLKNISGETKTLTIIGAVEPVLSVHEDDVAHREYNNMFVELSRDNERSITAKRKSCPFFLSLTCDEKAWLCGSRAMLYSRRLSPSVKGVLDPCMWAKCNLTVTPGEEKSVSFYLLAAESKPKLKSYINRVLSDGFLETSFRGGSDETERACAYASVIDGAFSLYSDASLVGKINTNLPTVALEVTQHSLARVKRDARALATLYKHGFEFNLAILYKERFGYLTTIANECEYMLSACKIRELKRPNCSVLTVNGVSDLKLYENLLLASVNINEENEPFTRDFTVVGAALENADLPPVEYALKTGKGGFLSGGEYAFDASIPPPKPWCNIIATEEFGTLLTDNGGGYTFEANSRQNKLTKWSNDAVLDEPSELVLLCERGNLWSPARSVAVKNCEYRVEYGFGYGKYICNYNGFISELTEFIGRTKVKYYKLTLKNQAKFSRSVDATLALNLVLGDFRQYTSPSIFTKRNENRLYAVNALTNMEAFVDSSEKLRFPSFNFRALKSKSGEFVRAAACEISGSQLIYGTRIYIGAEEEKTVYFCLSCGDEVDFSIADDILAERKKFYSSLSCVNLKSQDKALDFIYKWLPYQTLCSRFWGRTGFYQASGAYGFRDQLQDAMAINYINPKLTKEHILLCASRQFEKGDVVHWWHEGIGGVRTHFVDDRLFLPLAVSDYIKFTGDSEILSERVPFLQNVNILPTQKSVYEGLKTTEKRASILKHCLLAIKSVEINADGLILMKGGDWNDGMDKAGEKGKGVSVFATMLLYLTIKRFMPYFTDANEKAEMLTLMEKLRSGVDTAWENDRFARLVTDDGIVLGAENSPECKIDLLSQAFAVLSETAGDVRAEIAISTALEKLVDKKYGIIKLLTPPIKNTPNIGYISDYPEGVRENGGQYTHAAVWFIIACFSLGKIEVANELLELINPINHSLTAEAVEKYKVEPYVVSADVYSGINVGEGGWSWYTGAAGWFYRCITENMLGIEIKNSVISFRPKLSNKHDKLKVEIKLKEYHFTVLYDNAKKTGEWKMSINGVAYNTCSIKLSPSLNGSEIRLIRS